MNYLHYADRTLRRLYTQQAGVADYRTRLGIVGWGAFAGADYRSADDRLSVSGGLRFDGCDWSGRTARLWERLSPRLSFSYALGGGWSVGASTGLYYQLPPLTALGFRDGAGVLVNRDLGYMRVAGSAAGFDWRLRDRLVVSVEGFYKYYTDIPLSVTDGIPLTCKGNDYGTVGDEPLVSSAEGRAYGVEAMVRWRIPGKISLVGSATLYRSEFRRDRRAEYIPSAWDSRFVVNLSGTYDLPRAWSVGGQTECCGPGTLHALRRRKIVAERGLGRFGAPVLRLLAVQPRSARRFRPTGRAGGQDLLFPSLYAGCLPRPAERHG